MGKITAITATILVIFGLTACAELKETGRTIGHTTRDVTTEIGHTTRDATKAIGHATRDTVKQAKEELAK